MGCLNATITTNYKPAEASILLTTESLYSTISMLKQIDVEIDLIKNVLNNPYEVLITRLNTTPNMEIKESSKRLKASVGIVCTLELLHDYLEVEPEHIWLVPSNNYSQEFIVYSNTNWIIN